MAAIKRCQNGSLSAELAVLWTVYIDWAWRVCLFVWIMPRCVDIATCIPLLLTDSCQNDNVTQQIYFPNMQKHEK